MFTDWILQSLIEGGFWVILGSVAYLLGRNRVKMRVYQEIRGYVMADVEGMLAFIQEHPERVKPIVDVLMSAALNSPGGILPKEATVKIPILGKVPASWFEPLVKQALGKFQGMADNKVEEVVKNAFDR